MRPILRVEVLPISEYEAIRADFRARVIAKKKARRLSLGDHMSMVFENRDTVHLQIQEMLRTEGITTESAIKHEINTYNELVPGPSELSVTAFVEIADKETRDRMLVELAGLEDAIFLEVKGRRFPFYGKREGASPTRTTAVHYLKVKLDEAAIAAIRAGEPAAIVVTHPQYAARSELSAEVISELAEDLG